MQRRLTRHSATPEEPNSWRRKWGETEVDLHRSAVAMPVDFTAYDYDRDACLLVLVERGPWPDALEDHLKSLEDRLYECLDAALDGQLAQRFPEAANKKVIVRVDCHRVPRHAIYAFMERFSEHVQELPDYSPESSPWVRSFDFEVVYNEAG